MLRYEEKVEGFSFVVLLHVLTVRCHDQGFDGELHLCFYSFFVRLMNTGWTRGQCGSQAFKALLPRRKRNREGLGRYGPHLGLHLQYS